MGFLTLKSISEDIQDSDKILVVGCGNSPFSEELYKAGYRNLISTDYSEVVIDDKKRHPQMQWQVADVLTLENYSDESLTRH